MKRRRVIIIGMGFGGLKAAHALADKGLDVLVLDRQNFHLFQPLLYQVATAMIDQEAIAHSIRAIIRHWGGVRFQMSEVRQVDFDKQRVVTPDGDIPYDYLIVAAGSVTNFFGIESIQQHAFDLKQLDDAVALRNHVLSVFERAAKEPDPETRAALMSFVIVGGGPTGVEFAGSLSELTHHVLNKDFPELPLRQSQITLLEASPSVLGPFAKRLQIYARRRLERMGVKVRLRTPVAGAESDRVLLKDGSEIRAYTLFWAAGVKAAPLADALDVPKAKSGRIIVQQDVTIKEHPEVYVIGDLAHLEQDGAPLPMVAPVAMQQGEYVARAILKREAGRAGDIKPFRYFDKGSMAVIGRSSAVAMAGGLNLSGLAAWWAWLLLHLFYLIGFRNRLVTMIDWAYDYLFFDRQVRLITDQYQIPEGIEAVAAGSDDGAAREAHNQTERRNQPPRIEE